MSLVVAADRRVPAEGVGHAIGRDPVPAAVRHVVAQRGAHIGEAAYRVHAVTGQPDDRPRLADLRPQGGRVLEVAAGVQVDIERRSSHQTSAVMRPGCVAQEGRPGEAGGISPLVGSDRRPARSSTTRPCWCCAASRWRLRHGRSKPGLDDLINLGGVTQRWAPGGVLTAEVTALSCARVDSIIDVDNTVRQIYGGAMRSPAPGTDALLWPDVAGPDALAAIERIPLEDRGIPASTRDVVERAAEMWADEPAMSWMADAGRWRHPSRRTFSQLASDVRRAAAGFARIGVGRRDAVAIISTNCEHMATALLAAEWSGIAAPLNPTLSIEHASQLVRRAGAQVIVAAGPELSPGAWETARVVADAVQARTLVALRPTLADAEPPTLDGLPNTDVIFFDELCCASPDEQPVGPAASDVASYLHTGGTTGVPKLAVRSHANEVTNAWMMAATSSLADGESIFAGLPLFHTNALIVTLLAPLLKGQHVVWAGPAGFRDPELYPAFWQIVEHHRIAAMSAVPTVYSALVQVPVDADISSLQLPGVGAAPLPPALAEAFRDHTGVELCEGYGLTEGTCATARTSPGEARGVSVGQRLPYQDVRAAKTAPDGDWLFLPPGEVGTLVLRGPNVFMGYLVEGPEGPQPHSGGAIRDGWLDTGDIGSVDADGYVTLAGRTKDIIIRGGHNIDPAVIEDALMAHPAVSAASAVGQPDAHAGEVPVAYVEVAGDASVQPEELEAWATDHVPERAAVPRVVEVVGQLPLTSVGKPYKPELRRRATERAAREALGDASAVRADLVDGQVVVLVDGDPDAAGKALAPFTFAWKMRVPDEEDRE